MPAEDVASVAPQWVAQIAGIRQELALPPNYRCWTPYMTGTAVPENSRVRETIDVFAFKALLRLGADRHHIFRMSFQEKKDLLKDSYIDISQSPNYCRVCVTGMNMGCLATSSSIYSYGRDRMLVAQEHMLLQGHRRAFRLPAAPSRVRKLAGEGMCLPCLATIVWSMYLVRGLP